MLTFLARSVICVDFSGVGAVSCQVWRVDLGYKHDPNGASGRETVHLDNLRLAEQIILYVTFRNAHDPVAVQQRIYKEERNRLIRARHAAGEGLSDLAREYEISPQRVWQIVQSRTETPTNSRCCV